MGKLLFIPVGVAGGLAAGFLGKQIFSQIWAMIDEEEPPEGKHREVSVPKLAVAAALQGAIFRVTRELAEHGTRRAFQSVTGSWPGEERPEPE